MSSPKAGLWRRSFGNESYKHVAESWQAPRKRSGTELGTVKRIRVFMFEWELSPRALLAVSGVVALLLGVLALSYLDQGGEPVEVKGVVVAPFEQPSEALDAYFLRVIVPPGEEVRVRISREVPIRPGKAVILMAGHGSRFGRTRYWFSRYADAEPAIRPQRGF